MIAPTLSKLATERASYFHSLPRSQQPGWLRGELQCLLRAINNAVEQGDGGMLIRYAAMLAQAHDVDAPALIAAAEADNGD